MSTPHWGRWMRARDAGDGGKWDATEVMVVPGGVLVRVVASCWHEAISTSVAFVPVAHPGDLQTFLARLGCDLRTTQEPALPLPPR